MCEDRRHMENLFKFDYKTKNLLKNQDKMKREMCGLDVCSNSKIQRQ